MIISVINHSNGQLSDETIQSAVRAINRQMREDFQPYWSIDAQLRLEGRSGKIARRGMRYQRLVVPRRD